MEAVKVGVMRLTCGCVWAFVFGLQNEKMINVVSW